MIGMAAFALSIFLLLSGLPETPPKTGEPKRDAHPQPIILLSYVPESMERDYYKDPTQMERGFQWHLPQLEYMAVPDFPAQFLSGFHEGMLLVALTDGKNTLTVEDASDYGDDDDDDDEEEEEGLDVPDPDSWYGHIPRQ